VSNKANSGVRRGPGGRGCKTNPISGSWPAGGIPSIPLFYHSTIQARYRLCKTNPIPGGAGWDGAWGTRGDCAKRSQFGGVSGGDAQPTKSRLCETKPNLGGLGQVGKGGHRVRGGFAGKWNVRNEPNSRRRRVGRGPNVQNEPNFAEPAGRIPHHSTVPSFQYSNPIPIMQNEAKLGQAGTSGGRRDREGPMAQNEPNRPPGYSRSRYPPYSIIPIFQSCKTKPISPDRPPGRTVAEFLLPWTARGVIILSVRK
jgi:hypothetical protein